MNEPFTIYAQLLNALDQKPRALPQDKSTAQNIVDAAKMLQQSSLCTTGAQADSLRLDAAMSYYVAGYYARAARTLTNCDVSASATPFHRWISMLLAKQLADLNGQVNSVIAGQAYSDDYISTRISDNTLADQLTPDYTFEDEAVNRVVLRVVADCIKDFLSFLETGNETLLTLIDDQITKCQSLAAKVCDYQLLWRLKCLNLVINEFTQNSLWNCLKPMMTEETGRKIVQKYIVACYHHKLNPFLELWRSQWLALPSINDAERGSFAVKLPTASGKTRIAELAILRFLIDYLDQSDAKCLYIAPYRTLASEVELAFREVFTAASGRGNYVSHFYGSYEVDLLEEEDLKTASVLICTPEKIDGLLRSTPDLMGKIKLVIADEGHMACGDTGTQLEDRNRRYRMLLERLIYTLKLRKPKAEREGARMFLLSGVLPNADDFAEWISGTRENTIDIPWRPFEQPIFHKLVWNGTEFINDITKRPFQIMPLYDENGDPILEIPGNLEAKIGRVAIIFAQQANTMLFSASKAKLKSPILIKPLVQALVKNPVLGFQPLPPNFRSAKDEETRDCYTLLEHCAALHHADLPAYLRAETERRIESGNGRLVLASPTLAQGVNLPLSTMIVYELNHSWRQPVSDATFWNIVGRVGRPIGNDPEGSGRSGDIWFVVDETESQAIPKHKTVIDDLLGRRDTYKVQSAFFSFLLEIKSLWHKHSSSADIEELVLKLAENDLSWVPDDADRGKYYSFMVQIDAQLCNLSCESKLLSTPVEDCLQEFTSDLLAILTGATELEDKDKSFVTEVLRARAKFVSRQPDRYRDYLLGLPQRDCDLILKHQYRLLGWYKNCTGLFTGDLEQGLRGLILLLEFISELSITRSPWKAKADLTMWDDSMIFDKTDIPTSESARRQALLKAWLQGEDIKDNNLLFQTAYPGQHFDDYHEDMLLEVFPWGISALSRYLSALAIKRNIPLTKDLSYLSTLVKYGTPRPIDCFLIRMGFSRPTAFRLGNLLAQNWMPQTEDIYGNVFVVGDSTLTIGSVSSALGKLKDTHKLTLNDNERVILEQCRERTAAVQIPPEP